MPTLNTYTSFLTTIILMFVYVGFAQAELESPKLVSPDNGANLKLKKATKFTWQKVAGATKYRLIFSNDKNFSNYDANKFKCLDKKNCFLYTVTSPYYNVVASHAMLKTGDKYYFWQAQAVGKKTIDDSKIGEIHSFSVGTIVPPVIQSISINPQKITLGSSITIRATLDRDLAVGFYSIQVSFDDNEIQTMTGSGTDFSFKFRPLKIGEQQFNIVILDTNSVPIDSKNDSFLVVSRTNSKKTGYTKIANNGSVLPDDAKLGTAPNDWACTQDNKTGLIWEIKTMDGGLRDAHNVYSWYKPGSDADIQNGNFCKKGIDCNTAGFVNAVNEQGLCGSNIWRLPTENELLSILSRFTLSPDSATNSPISPTYFPNTTPIFLWTSNPNDSNNSRGMAWFVYFSSHVGDANYGNGIRLVY
jgi:hypothetical protein